MSPRDPAPWATVWLATAHTLATRSKDPSTQCGAVLVDAANRVLGLGFNGAPPQLHDALVPWGERPAKYGFVIHAEENALLDAADKNPAERLRGATMYVTARPCPGCVLRMIRAGVRTVVWDSSGRQPKMCDPSAAEQTAAILAALKPAAMFDLVEWRG